MPLEEVKVRAFQLLIEFGFNRDILEQSPFQMSGGQMRKIAITSILAMDPDIVILDEPTAGLDPKSRNQIMEMLKKLQVEQHKTIILVTHEMNNVAKYVDEVKIKQGKLVESCSPSKLFNANDYVKDMHLDVPDIVKLQRDIEAKHQIKFDRIALTESEFTEMYKEWQKMRDKFIIGRYLPLDTFVHRRDPRAKLIFVFLFIILIFLHIHFYLFMVIYNHCNHDENCSYKSLVLIKGLTPIWIFLIFTFLMHLFLTKGGIRIFEFGFISIDTHGILEGIYIVLRLMFIIMVSTIMTLTTSPLDLTDAFERLLYPLKLIKIPVHLLSMMMSIALRFIPTLMNELDKIILAQKSRGSEISSGD